MKQYNVGGMSCAACSARVERAVSALDGVKTCSVNLLTSSMSVEGEVSAEEVIAAVTAAGYTASLKGEKALETADALENKETPRLVRRLVASLVFLVFLMYFSMGSMLGLPLPDALESAPVSVGLIQLLLSSAVLVINQKFFISGSKALVMRAPNMDTLVALGSFASYAYSVYVLFKMIFEPSAAGHYLHDLYFESAAMILALITVGKMLESIAKGRTTNAIKSLMSLSPKTATLIRDGKEVQVPIDDVRVGDVFVVRPGESVATDAEVIEGESAVDESALTGESIPAEKTLGDRVYAGTVNKSGFLKCRATSVGEGTAISAIIKMVSDAAATKAPIAKIADKVSGVFVPFVLGVALVATVVWLGVGETFGYALARGISVLVISCPCALGLATPVAIMVGSGVGARRGILFKNATALEVSGRVKNVVLDKTGTITEGRPRVAKIATFGVSEEELFALSAAAESRSEHPLAIAVCDAARERGVDIPEASGFEAVTGGGVKATVDGAEIFGGSKRFITEHLEIPADAGEIYEAFAKEGATPLIFAKNSAVIGIISVRDKIKEDSAEAIAELKRMGIKVTMLTGDNELSARSVAKEAGVDEVIAGVLPDGKERAVAGIAESGAVMMVGDGINDAPALTRADVGVAIGRGTDVAIDSADVVLMNSKLSDVVSAVKLGRRVLGNIKQNLFWAFCYNVIGIPLAAGAFVVLFGWEMNPMFGAAAMSLSSFSVVMNALRLNFALPKAKTQKEDEVKASDLAKEATPGRIFSVSGMMCGHCEVRVKGAIEELVGVESAVANHKSGTVLVLADESVSDEDIRAAITAAGYKVK